MPQMSPISWTWIEIFLLISMLLVMASKSPSFFLPKIIYKTSKTKKKMKW